MNENVSEMICFQVLSDKIEFPSEIEIEILS